MPDYRNSSACHSEEDGDCFWERCPQLRDGEPQKSGRHCPLDKIRPCTHGPEEAKRLIAEILEPKP
jgi:hypothetical protein